MMLGSPCGDVHKVSRNIGLFAENTAGVSSSNIEKLSWLAKIFIFQIPFGREQSGGHGPNIFIFGKKVQK